jgi:heat shock protein HtpX
MPPHIRRLQEENVRKTWILMTGFLVALIAAGYLFAQYTGNPSFLYGFIGVSVLMNLIGYFASAKIALAAHRAKPADPARHGRLIAAVNDLSARTGIPAPKAYVIPDASMNAFATGRNPANAAVAATEGLLASLDDAELRGVIAHELAHVRNRDILVQTVVVVLAGVFSILADFAGRSMLFGGGGDRESRGPLVLVGLALSILAPIGALLVQLAVSRKREFLADATGAEIAGTPHGLASALGKIATQRRPLATAGAATAHMFIENPFGADHERREGEREPGGLAKLFMTHPPVRERIAALLGHSVRR